MLDHLVYATPDLAATVDDLNARSGLTLTPGGRHEGLGTRNFLADLGDGGFLEVIGPDVDQPTPAEPRPFGVDFISAPVLLTWAARVDDLDAAMRSAEAAGYPMGPVITMGRDRGDGVPLSWRLAMPADAREQGGLVPFLVQWDTPAHPAETAAKGMRLVGLTGITPDPEAVRQRVGWLGQHLDVQHGPQRGLRAVLDTPAGEVVLGLTG